MYIIVFLLVFCLIVIATALFIAVEVVSRFVGGLHNLWAVLTGKEVKKDSRRGWYSYKNTDYSTTSNSSASNYSNSSRSSQTGGTYRSTSTRRHKPGEKVFKDDEGVYVDFVETKS